VYFCVALHLIFVDVHEYIFLDNACAP